MKRKSGQSSEFSASSIERLVGKTKPTTSGRSRKNEPNLDPDAVDKTKPMTSLLLAIPDRLDFAGERIREAGVPFQNEANIPPPSVHHPTRPRRTQPPEVRRSAGPK